MAIDQANEIREELIREIEQAFQGVHREDGVSLHEAQAIDDHLSDALRQKARRLDTDRNWQDIPDGTIERHYSIFPFLDLKGFRYYLPAYMRWALRHYQTSQSASTDFTIYTLTSANKAGRRARDLEWFGIFNAVQARAVARFLRFMVQFGAGFADETEAQRALDGYWGRFL